MTQRVVTLEQAQAVKKKTAVDKWDGHSLIPPTATEFPGLISTAN